MSRIIAGQALLLPAAIAVDQYALETLVLTVTIRLSTLQGSTVHPKAKNGMMVAAR
ncbi:MAG: hypothetical protein GW911_30570 [Armatimonadetes bacterium]|nr:hypothetical protein [Armatimonadota bacterium]NCO89969.1 hypothetical protein [Armatimonadota bacterium]NCP30742.1 hypothetical protein [Armatimonadota bacterium]NCQ29621.1 hypothetical protein [Armatimonadota bacterium]NDK16395.1 hypothetical protein [Armatimonadota bacterium]